MKKIQLNARFKIHPGKFDEVIQIAAECMAIVQKKEVGKGILQYDWFFSPDQTECVVRETYIDSDALMTHMGNLGEPLGRLMGTSDFELEVYGNPSEELQQAGAPLNPKVYSFFQGL